MATDSSYEQCKKIKHTTNRESNCSECEHVTRQTEEASRMLHLRCAPSPACERLDSPTSTHCVGSGGDHGAGAKSGQSCLLTPCKRLLTHHIDTCRTAMEGVSIASSEAHVPTSIRSATTGCASSTRFDSLHFSRKKSALSKR